MSQKIYSMLNDEQIKLLALVDKAISDGKEMKTFYPGCIWRLTNGSWYEFFTNEPTKKMEHIATVIEHLNSPYAFKFNECAVALDGSPVPDAFSVWVPVRTVPHDVLNEYFELSYQLSRRYRELLVQCGIPKDELTDITDVYIGCEKNRWPDKPWITDKILQLIKDTKK